MHPDEKSTDLLKGTVETRKKALYGAEVVLAEFPRAELKSHEAQTNLGGGKRISNASSSSAYSSRHSASSIGSVAAASLRDSIYSLHDSAATCSSDGEQVNGSLPRGSIVPQYPHLPTIDDETQGEDEEHHPHVTPEVTLTLQVTLPVSEQQELARLLITATEAHNLPPREYGTGAPDAFLTLHVLRGAPSSMTYPNILLEARTRTIRRASSPSFQETFSTDLRRVDIKEAIIEVAAVDQDRHANSSVLCRGQIHLASLTDTLMTSHGPQQIVMPMQICQEKRGECLISVTWLPTAQRVSFSVMRVQGLQKNCASNLPGPLIFMTVDACKAPEVRVMLLMEFIIQPVSVVNEVKVSLGEYDYPYIRIIQLSSLGRSLKRKKTPPAIRISDAADVASFPETISFDVPPLQAENATFLITVWHRVLADKATPHSSSSDDNEQQSVDLCPDICLGKIALGRTVRGTAESLHWTSVLQNPRKVITHWHTLY